MSYTLPGLITTIPADLQPVPECVCCGTGGALSPPLLGTRLEGGHADHHEVPPKPHSINIGYGLIPRVSATWPHSRKLMFTRNMCMESLLETMPSQGFSILTMSGYQLYKPINYRNLFTDWLILLEGLQTAAANCCTKAKGYIFSHKGHIRVQSVHRSLSLPPVAHSGQVDFHFQPVHG